MFFGRFTTGDKMIDNFLYMEIGILLMEVFIFFVMPLLEMAFNMKFLHPFF